jgi:hypothetical protein
MRRSSAFIVAACAAAVLVVKRGRGEEREGVMCALDAM